MRELQYYLYLMSAYEPTLPSVTIDGEYGSATEKAVRAYQRLAGLTADGVAGRATWNSLYARASRLRLSGPVVTVNRMSYPGAPLEVGSAGEAVNYYSVLLARIAYYFPAVSSPGVTAAYTEALAEGTRSFQQLVQLPATGRVDADTWTAAEALGIALLTGALDASALALPAAGGEV